MKLHEVFLERSRNMPLFVYLQLGENDRYESRGQGYDTVDTDFLALIVPHIRRIEVLELDLTWSNDLSDDFFRPPDSIGAPLLRRLLLYSLNPDDTTSIEKMIHPAPQLRELVWEDQSRGPSFSWRGLTKLTTTERLDLQECVTILREACNTVVDATFAEVVEIHHPLFVATYPPTTQ